jgi:hypothetical protein
LAERLQARIVDPDDGDDGLLRLLAMIDALIGIERPDTDFLDRRGIGDPQRGKADQQRETRQSRVTEPAGEPASEDS